MKSDTGIKVARNPVEELKMAPIKNVIDFMRHFSTDEKCLEYLLYLKLGQKGWAC